MMSVWGMFLMITSWNSNWSLSYLFSKYSWKKLSGGNLGKIVKQRFFFHTSNSSNTSWRLSFGFFHHRVYSMFEIQASRWANHETTKKVKWARILRWRPSVNWMRKKGDFKHSMMQKSRFFKRNHSPPSLKKTFSRFRAYFHLNLRNSFSFYFNVREIGILSWNSKFVCNINQNFMRDTSKCSC